MDLNELLIEKLKKDLFEELKSLDIPNLSEKINKKISENPISIEKNKCNKFKGEKSSRCCARIMGERYSDERCMNKSQKDKEYCKNHIKRIENYGYLAFKRYDECRPIINERGTKIPWRDTTATEDINILIQYQNMKLCKNIK